MLRLRIAIGYIHKSTSIAHGSNAEYSVMPQLASVRRSIGWFGLIDSDLIDVEGESVAALKRSTDEFSVLTGVQEQCCGAITQETAPYNDEDIADYVAQIRRCAAYSILRWGSNESQCLETAQLLLTNPELGMSMLCENEDTCDVLDMPTDMCSRRVVDYLKSLRVHSDMQYARALAHGDALLPLSTDANHACGFAEVDARYLYDAHRVVPAYKALWHEDTVCSAGIMDQVAHGNPPTMPIWRNVVYLDDLTQSLMGASFATDLIVGFAARDEERFTEGVEQLEQFAACVESAGFAALPGVVLGTYAADIDVSVSLTPQEWHAKRRIVNKVGDSMAAVVLCRMPSDNLARRAALAMITCDVDGYAALVREIRGIPGRGILDRHNEML